MESLSAGKTKKVKRKAIKISNRFDAALSEKAGPSLTAASKHENRMTAMLLKAKKTSQKLAIANAQRRKLQAKRVKRLKIKASKRRKCGREKKAQSLIIDSL